MDDVVDMNATIDNATIDVIQRHEALRGRLLRNFGELDKDPDLKLSFVTDMYTLLKDIKYQYTMIDGPRRTLLYNIARTSCVDLVTMLGETTPEDCLPFPPPDPADSSPPSKPFTELQFTTYVRQLAQRISDDHAKYHPYMGSDQNRDWHDAEIYFARDVLTGTIRFDTRVQPESFWRLENIWINEVVRLGAYHEWEAQGRHIDKANQVRDYYTECNRCTQLLVNPALKAPPKQFVAAKSYFLSRYIQNGTRVDIHHDMVQQLIARKLHKAGQAQNAANPAIHDHVTEYVTEYYNNIIPAIEHNKDRAAEIVLNAFRRSQNHESQSSIINAFEAAVAIYFIDSNIIQQLWRAPIVRATGIF